ncbi:MAG: NADH dehydrogenase FAD-containing subunit [Oligosphaeraceae bacterium]|nr:NADH dehydrogenase FAD-containing subunit [Oligosphaeraceae bacterium]
MPLLLNILIPTIFAGIIFILGERVAAKQTRRLFVLAALLNFFCSVFSLQFFYEGSAAFRQWLFLDHISTPILLLTASLFVWVSIHTVGWLQAIDALTVRGAVDGPAAPTISSRLYSEAIFLACMLLFLGAMNLAISATNLSLFWVAIEATTLVSAPLICFQRSKAALEAMWKYLLICSLGIALALLGLFFLAIADPTRSGLNFFVLRECANLLDLQWGKAAFILILAGYGTKMGLAPFHTWLPDTYSATPGVVSALLSGALLNCAFLGILRITQIMPEALHTSCKQMLLALGFLSLFTAAVFVIRQQNYKRLLGYSSIEHMGLLAIILACSLRAPLMQRVLVWHLVGHSMLKVALFLLAGNIVLAYGTRSVNMVKGMFESMKWNASLFLLFLLLLCGCPPSPLFATELLLILELSSWQGAVLLLLLFMVAAGMLHAAMRMCMGSNPKRESMRKSALLAEKLAPMPAISGFLALFFGCSLLYMLLKLF